MRPHFAIIASPVPGHYDPLRVLGRKLVQRGARVTFVHMPDAVTLVQAPELEFEAVDNGRFGPGALARFTALLTRAGTPLGGLRMIRAQAAITGLLLDELPDALLRIGATAVIADAAEPAGALVARHLGLPFVSSVTGLPLLRDPSIPPPFVDWPYVADGPPLGRDKGGWFVTELLMRPIATELAEAGRRWGLDPRAHDGLSPLLQVAQCPPALDFPRSRLPAHFRYTGPWREPGSATLPPRDARPLIYCSLGSLQGNRPHVFAAMTRACADLGGRAVVAHGGRLSADQLAQLPGDPVIGAHWHQPSVLPHCAAAILHAGFNTVLDALAAGIPLVVAPIAFEQPGTAARVVWSGAGVKINARNLSHTALRTALAGVLQQPAYATAARGLAGEIASLGGADEAADLSLAAVRTGMARPTMASPAANDVGGDTRQSGSR